ncbi:MAG: hypothetical protein ABSH36_09990 [Solirubrobacteraceae bacterium]|jgi:hypothetical protein
MNSAVAGGALVAAAINAIPMVVGGWSWYRWHPSRLFWVLLRIGQGAAVVFALAVGVLAAAGHTSSERLFYLYALLPLAVAFVAEQLRIASAQTILDQRGLENAQEVGRLPESEQQAVVASIVRREQGIMALSALVVVFLLLRAAETAHGI